MLAHKVLAHDRVREALEELKVAQANIRAEVLSALDASWDQRHQIQPPDLDPDDDGAPQT